MNRKKMKQRRLELGLTLQEVADKLGLTRATIQKYESGYIKGVDTEILEKLSQVLLTTPSYLMGWDDNDYIEPNITSDYTTFPVTGDIAAGFDHVAVENWSGETIDVPNSYLKGRSTSDFFVLGVKGDSMFPTYREGDKVLILKQSTMDYSGQVGAIIYDDECATLKKIEYKQGENWLRLVPINPIYTTVFIENERLEHCRILGIPRLLVREIDER